MKTCPVCRKRLSDDYQFCPEDGSSIKDFVMQESSARDSRLVTGERESETVLEKAAETAAPLLYCPACSIEYPLTFSRCPAHGITLTRERPTVSIKRPTNLSSAKREDEPHEGAQVISSPTPEINVQERQGEPECSDEALLYAERLPGRKPALPVRGNALSLDLPEGRVFEVEDGEDYYYESGFDQQTEARPPKRSHRIAAALTAVCLIAFALVSAYVLYSKAGRKPSNKNSEIAQAPLVIKVPADLAKQTEVSSVNQTEKEERAEQEPPSSDEQAGREVSVEPPDHRQAHATQTADRHDSSIITSRPVARNLPLATPVRAQGAQLPPVPPAVSSRVEARLVRARSIRTGSGYQYEMTFNLQDIAGQVTQWERLIIATHSASGKSRNQVIPFFHRLGASGALTFTVSVEMDGRTEADWRGRVICTSIGSDNSGRAHRASFGASVAP